MSAIHAHHGVLLAASAPASSDPYWSNVVVLVNMSDSDGTTFTDQTARHTWAAMGNAKIVSNWYVGDGSGDYISSASLLGDFLVGAGDFTIECFIKTATKNIVLFDFRRLSESGIVMYLDASGFLGAFCNAGGSVSLAGATDLTDNAMHHVAFSRVAGTLYLCVDGAAVTSGALANNLDGSFGSLVIGADNAGSTSWNGSLRGVRLTKGVGRYSGSYTAPAWPLPT